MQIYGTYLRKFSTITKINGSELCLECLGLFVLGINVRIKSNIYVIYLPLFQKERHTFECAYRRVPIKWNWSLWGYEVEEMNLN